MPTVFVTGANSGIGHAFAEAIIKEGHDVIAADIQLGDKIKALGCKTIQLDVSSESSIQSAAQSLSGQTIDILLNVAGVMSPRDKDKLGNVSLEVLQRTFAVNTYGPILLSQALLPNLLQSSSPKIGVVSSRVGSIGDNSSGGGSYAYRASKAAVNSLFKSLSVDLKDKKVPVHILHPGYVNTNIVGDESIAHIPGVVEPEEAATKLWALFKSKGFEETGRFWHREGQELPW